MSEDNITGSNSSTTVQQPLMAQQHPQFIKWQLENDEPIEKLENRLKGLVFDFGKNEYVQKHKPLINSEGAFWVVCQVEALTDKIFQLSNFDSEEINDLIVEFEHLLISHLFSHYRDYELDYISDMESIKFLAKSFAFASMKRAFKAGAYKGLSIGTQHTEVINDREKQKKKLFEGWFGESK